MRMAFLIPPKDDGTIVSIKGFFHKVIILVHTPYKRTRAIGQALKKISPVVHLQPVLSIHETVTSLRLSIRLENLACYFKSHVYYARTIPQYTKILIQGLQKKSS